ncbi:ABC transporter ATP-binding protein [Actinomycetes bacterium]|nr:ABC transporter ATP-binding protein [Actinomycetes bacterium]
MSPVFESEAVGLTYPDGTEALRNTNVSVASGEFVSIVGPSGCGKSTLLRIASGLIAPTCGSTNRTGTVQFVFQDSTLLPWRSVRRNVSLNLELQKAGKSETEKRTNSALELVGLLDSAEKLPRQLSGGMKMRTSLARSLVCEPDLYLFDEPFAALDEFSRERLNVELLAMLSTRNAASLFVTHSIAEAVFLSHRVLVMSPRPGTIVQEFVIPFGPDRQQDLRYSPEFARLSGEIAQSLRELIAL